MTSTKQHSNFNQVYMNIFLRILAHTRTAMKTNFLSNMLATQKKRLKKVLKTLKNYEKSDLSEVTYVSRLLRSKLSKGEKSYQPNLDHSYTIRKNSYCKAIVKKYLSQNRLYSPLLIGPLVSVILKTLYHVKISPVIWNYHHGLSVWSLHLSSLPFLQYNTLKLPKL